LEKKSAGVIFKGRAVGISIFGNFFGKNGKIEKNAKNRFFAFLRGAIWNFAYKGRAVGEKSKIDFLRTKKLFFARKNFPKREKRIFLEPCAILRGVR